jgi:hypothetical protein
MSNKPQNFENHAKMVPGFHYLGSILLLSLLIWAVLGVVRGGGLESIMVVIGVVTLILIGFYARSFALGVQDRVIRLEERLRMAELLPEDLRPRIHEFSTEQLIGLRFASDEELPGLARRVLDEGIADRKTIKEAVTHWRADHQRV